MVRIMGAATYFAYDELDRLIRRQTPDGRVVEWAYDANSNVTTIKYPDATAAYYTYDQLDRMTSALSPDNHAAYFFYDEVGNMTKKILGNGAYAYFAYDAAEQLSKLENYDGNGTLLSKFEINRDARSDIISYGRAAGRATYFEYEDVRHLTKQTNRDSGGAIEGEWEWTYDAAGNRSYQKETFGGSTAKSYYTYDESNAATHKHVLGAGYTYYAYDLNGSLVRKQTPSGTTYLEYGDHGLVNRLKYRDGTDFRFHYDGQLSRLAVEKDGTVTYFCRDGLNVLAEYEGGAETVKYTHGATPINGIGSVVEAYHAGGDYDCPSYDWRGSVQDMTDANGTPTTYYEYNAFGREIKADRAAGLPANPHRYQTNWRHLVGEFYESPTRIYDAEDGRFGQRDHLERGGERNTYELCRANPLRYADPTGQYDIIWKGAWTEPQQVQVSRSLRRLRHRLTRLVRDVTAERWNLQDRDDDRRILQGCAAPLFRTLIHNLDHLRSLLRNMADGIDFKRKLAFRREDLGEGRRALWRESPGVRVRGQVVLDAVVWFHQIWPNEIALNINPHPGADWFRAGNDRRDDTMFHELSHEHGTKDPGGDDPPRTPWNDAVQVMDLMFQNFRNWPVYTNDLRRAEARAPVARQ